jgi:hypothetical protein
MSQGIEMLVIGVQTTRLAFVTMLPAAYVVMMYLMCLHIEVHRGMTGFC